MRRVKPPQFVCMEKDKKKKKKSDWWLE